MFKIGGWKKNWGCKNFSSKNSRSKKMFFFMRADSTPPPAHLGLITNKKWKKTFFLSNLQLTWFLEIYYLNFAEILGFKKPRISKLRKFPECKLRGSPLVGQLIVPKWTFPCFLQPEGTRGVVNDLNNVFEWKKLVLGHRTQKFIILIWYWVYWDGIGMVLGGIGCIGTVLGWYWVLLGGIGFLVWH